MKYYIYSEIEHKLVECSEEEYNLFNENLELNNYINKVYKEEISIDEVPDDLQKQVREGVEKKIAEQGSYDDQPVESDELMKMLGGMI